jgi:cell division septal protein FtsQ
VADRNGERSRRNVRLALIHGAIALGFLLLFVWSQLRS